MAKIEGIQLTLNNQIVIVPLEEARQLYEILKGLFDPPKPYPGIRELNDWSIPPVTCGGAK